jgi:hypothetical protein
MDNNITLIYNAIDNQWEIDDSYYEFLRDYGIAINIEDWRRSCSCEATYIITHGQLLDLLEWCGVWGVTVNILPQS